MRFGKWLFPIGFATAGFVLFAGGMAWAIATGTELPRPDATPQMQAYDDFQGDIAGILISAGIAAYVLAVLSALVAGAFELRRRKVIRGFPVIPLDRKSR
jgi:hypothetical protein